MKRAPLTGLDLIKQMTGSEQLPTNVDQDGNEVPTSDVERLAVHASLVEFAQSPDNIRATCVVCAESYPLLQMALCTCGSMVCQACQAVEEEGVCQHEPRSLREALADARDQQTTMEQSFQSFAEQMLPDDVPAETLAAIRSTFMSGAFSATVMMRRALARSTPRQFLVEMRTLIDEMQAWYNENDDIEVVETGEEETKQ